MSTTNLDKKITKNNYHQPLPYPHPAIEKYHFTIGDVHHHAITLGLAPPTLFGILIGRIATNSVINDRLSIILSDDDIRALEDDYNPLRHYAVVDDKDCYHDAYTVYQNYPAGMIQPRDGIHIDTGQWIIISHVDMLEHTIRLYSRGVVVMTLYRATMMTVAVYQRVTDTNLPPQAATYSGVSPKSIQDSKEKFFGHATQDRFDYDELYRTIKSTISIGDIQDV